MGNQRDVNVRLAEVQDALLALDDHDFAAKYELLKEQDKLREEAAAFAMDQDAGRSDEELLAELGALRGQMMAIEDQGIDLVYQAGTGGVSNMGNLGGVGSNRGIGEAQGLSRIKNRIGIIKNTLGDRGVEVPDPD